MVAAGAMLAMALGTTPEAPMSNRALSLAAALIAAATLATPDTARTAPSFPLMASGLYCVEYGTLPDCPDQGTLDFVLNSDGTGTVSFGGATPEGITWTFDPLASPQLHIDRDLFPSLDFTGDRWGATCVRGQYGGYGYSSDWGACW